MITEAVVAYALIGRHLGICSVGPEFNPHIINPHQRTCIWDVMSVTAETGRRWSE